MIVTDFINTMKLMLRDQVADDVRKWADTTLVNYGSLMERDIVKRLANSGEQYSVVRAFLPTVRD